MTEEGTADEVKVFRRHDEDVETEEEGLADDKKDVDLEEEMESKRNLLGGKGAFQPTAAASPSFNPLIFSPNYSYHSMLLPFMANPATMATAAYMHRQLSPAYAAMMMNPLGHLLGGGPMSPSFDQMYRLMAAQQASPLATPKLGVAGGSVHLPASVRGMNPLNQMNQMMPSAFAPSTATATHHGHNLKRPRMDKESKEKHIKKPMNAFMWFMKENRPKLMEEMEYKEKQSAELNKELGKRWQELDKEEQTKYYDLAKRDKEEHQKKYPNWTARENYAVHKRKKKKRDRQLESGEAKKCRARFGVTQQEKWCPPCRRKKKCMYSGDDRIGGEGSAGGSGREDEETERSSSTQQRASDSESDLEDEPMVTVSDMHVLDIVKKEGP